MAAFYLAAGTVHLVAPDEFLPIVPDFVPIPRDVVLATGLCEIAGGLALLTTGLRRLAGVLLALYAVFVFPANLKHAFLFCAGVIDWPWHKNGPTGLTKLT
jgi:uncharacterized membrane protein